MFIIFLGTLEQVDLGIQEVQIRYFQTFFIFYNYPQNWPASFIVKNWYIPLPGGYLLGCLLLINLFFSHIRYYNPKRKKWGIFLIHLGLVFLIISGFTTSFWKKESQICIQEGCSTNFSEDYTNNEFVIIDKSNVNFDTIFNIPISLLKSKIIIDIKELPFLIQCDDYFDNSSIGLQTKNLDSNNNQATEGIASKIKLVVWPKEITYKQNNINTATAYITLKDRNGDSIGRWLVSNLISEQFPPQEFENNNNYFQIALRFQRHYYPFALELLEFRHDRYPGTTIPRNFSSLIKIKPYNKIQSYQFLISMNNPLRYNGYTFYQASFLNQDKTSILQVVKNPTWQLPYCSVLIIGIGLITQFTTHLIKFLSKKQK